MLQGSRQTFVPRAIRETVEEHGCPNGVMHLGTIWRVQFDEPVSYCAECSIAVHNVDVDTAKRHARTTIGIRVVQLRTASRNLAKPCELQRIRQRIFKPLSSHKRLDVA